MSNDNTAAGRDDHLKFLAEKIHQVRKAIFRADSGTRLALPNNIIETLDTDSDGNIWFLTSCNDNYTKFTDHDFYAYLEYYQKEAGRLLISGVAHIQDAGLIPDRFKDRCAYLNNTTFMIRLKIMKAEYHECVFEKAVGWRQRAKNLFKIFFHPQLQHNMIFPKSQ